MLVKAATGTRCPMERKPRKYIFDNKAVEVAPTAYYRRMVADGSLVVEPYPGSAKAKPSSKKGKKLEARSSKLKADG